MRLLGRNSLVSGSNSSVFVRPDESPEERACMNEERTTLCDVLKKIQAPVIA